jgi:hypothetical protein
MAAVAPGELTARTERMRALSDEDRVAAIAGAGNVVGYDRFLHNHRQKTLREQYRKPIQGKRP